jgi:flavin-dependent dehydrogenase
MRYDVIVVGAGPAGALAAREVARRGASVLLLDRAAFPRRKVCGACVSAGAAEVLDAVGLGGLPASLGGKALRTLVVSAGNRLAHLPLEGGQAVSHEFIDMALVDAARREGVDFRSGAKADIGRVRGGTR